MQENTYFLGQDVISSESELVRLAEQARQIQEGILDIFPPAVDPSLVRRVLDIGSGSGDWAIEAAQAYPDCEVVGIDISEQMVKYGQAEAGSRGILNVQFQVMSALPPLSFPNGSFDVINSRFANSFVPQPLWGEVVREWKRVLRPGGKLILTEMDLSITTSAAWGQLLSWIAQVFNSFGKGFSIGSVAVLGKLLSDAGFTNIERYPYFLDCSFGTKLYPRWKQHTSLIMYEIKPLVLRKLPVKEEQFEGVFEQAKSDMLSPDFCFVSFILSAVGTA